MLDHTFDLAQCFSRRSQGSSSRDVNTHLFRTRALVYTLWLHSGKALRLSPPAHSHHLGPITSTMVAHYTLAAEPKRETLDTSDHDSSAASEQHTLLHHEGIDKPHLRQRRRSTKLDPVQNSAARGWVRVLVEP